MSSGVGNNPLWPHSQGALMPAPLCHVGELFPYLSPFEVCLLLQTVWRYMKVCNALCNLIYFVTSDVLPWKLAVMYIHHFVSPPLLCSDVQTPTTQMFLVLMSMSVYLKSLSKSMIVSLVFFLKENPPVPDPKENLLRGKLLNSC